VLAVASLCAAQQPATVSYTIDLSRRAEHILHVTMSLPPGNDNRTVQLPVWNALYQVRDFAQYVRDLHAKSPQGQPLAVEELDKTTWHLRGASRGATVDYDFFADLPPPFGIEANEHHAFLNLAEALMYSKEDRGSHALLHFVGGPDGWNVNGAFPASVASGPPPYNRTYVFENYDKLVDTPVEISEALTASFQQGGAIYNVVVDADPADYDMNAIVSALKRITHTEVDWMQDRPFDHYTFIYHIPRGPAGGGMEHANSTAISVSADRLRGDILPLADVSAHEFFHLWNVKRIRPQCLEPIDYTKEQYCTALWFSEGVTSTVGEYTLLRAGFFDEKHFFGAIAREIQELQERPARLTQSVEQSSLDAWLEKYPAYNLPERSISYYNKGFVDGVLLDLAILDATNGSKSLRDVFQHLNTRYAKQGRFFPDSPGIREAAEAVSGRDLSQFFARHVSGTDEIPYDQFLRAVGLRVNVAPRTVADAGFSAPRRFTPARVVASVVPGGPAQIAGIHEGDTVLSINGQPLTGNLDEQLSGMSAGAEVRIELQRGSRTREVNLKLGSREVNDYSLIDLDRITPGQRRLRDIWMHGAAQH
jgi:predicted metalloprotease with PDZ domain